MAVHSRAMAEAAFLDWSFERLEALPMACFLDSAGPIGARSQFSLLSDDLAGVFLQRGRQFEFWNLETGLKQSWSESEFCDWLEAFRLKNKPHEALFPIFCYEAFQDTAPKSAHPIWQEEADAIWLWAASHFVYDRKGERLYWHTAEQTPESWTLQGAKNSPTIWAPERPSEQPNGWRESESAYYGKIQAVKRDIYDGNYYQANLSQRFLGEVARHPLETYRALRIRNPSPFMGVFHFGPRWVVSGSPERLVEQRGDRLSSRPIAGTRPRFQDPERDLASQNELLHSEKERAEHLMLVDLARNDLGRIAAIGSVRVREFQVIESYSHVHHLVSEVCAQIAPGVSTFELLRSLFPCGTITGAPKISCMRRLAELEAEARGPYTGGFGYLNTVGDLDFNILIRTFIQMGRRVCFHAGGGIVADSLQEQEYLETRHKAMALMEALGLNC